MLFSEINSHYYILIFISQGLKTRVLQEENARRETYQTIVGHAIKNEKKRIIKDLQTKSVVDSNDESEKEVSSGEENNFQQKKSYNRIKVHETSKDRNSSSSDEGDDNNAKNNESEYYQLLIIFLY